MVPCMKTERNVTILRFLKVILDGLTSLVGQLLDGTTTTIIISHGIQNLRVGLWMALDTAIGMESMHYTQ